MADLIGIEPTNVVFAKVRDRLYAAITFAVLVILLVSFGVGLVGG